MGATKSEVLYDILKKEIINLAFNLDEVINEKTIAEKYNVSKTPAREALNNLVQDGYLVKYPRIGYFVKSLSLTEYYEIVQLRFILECGVAKTIIAYCTDEQIRSLYDVLSETVVPYAMVNEVNVKFHLAMAKLTNNRYLYQELTRVFELCNRKLNYDYYKNAQNDIHRDHKVIIKAMLDRDEARVVELLRSEARRSDDADARF